MKNIEYLCICLWTKAFLPYKYENYFLIFYLIWKFSLRVRKTNNWESFCKDKEKLYFDHNDENGKGLLLHPKPFVLYSQNFPYFQFCPRLKLNKEREEKTVKNIQLHCTPAPSQRIWIYFCAGLCTPKESCWPKLLHK